MIARMEEGNEDSLWKLKGMNNQITKKEGPYTDQYWQCVENYRVWLTQPSPRLREEKKKDKFYRDILNNFDRYV